MPTLAMPIRARFIIVLLLDNEGGSGQHSDEVNVPVKLDARCHKLFRVRRRRRPSSRTIDGAATAQGGKKSPAGVWSFDDLPDSVRSRASGNPGATDRGSGSPPRDPRHGTPATAKARLRASVMRYASRGAPRGDERNEGFGACQVGRNVAAAAVTRLHVSRGAAVTRRICSRRPSAARARSKATGNASRT